MICLDTNAVIALIEGSPASVGEVMRAITGISEEAGLLVCGAVYAEICAGSPLDARDVAGHLRDAHIRIDTVVPLDAWRSAGERYREHTKRRDRSGVATPRRILTDFIIGAHAVALGANVVLVTSDAAFFRRAFPSLCVVDPRS